MGIVAKAVARGAMLMLDRQLSGHVHLAGQLRKTRCLRGARRTAIARG